MKFVKMKWAAYYFPSLFYRNDDSLEGKNQNEIIKLLKMQ